MAVLKYDNDAYTDVFLITPASDTAIAEQRALLHSVTGTVTVRLVSGGTQYVLPTAVGVPLRLKVYSVDAVSGGTIHGLR